MIIAVRLDGMAVGEEDVRVALTGPTIGRLDEIDPTKVVVTGKHGAGLFRDASGQWRNRHVAGVLVWDTELRPWSITRQAPTLWLHPSPDIGVAIDLPWRQIKLDGVGPETVPGWFDPGVLFDLPDGEIFEDARDWPGKPFARAAP